MGIWWEEYFEEKCAEDSDKELCGSWGQVPEQDRLIFHSYEALLSERFDMRSHQL